MGYIYSGIPKELILKLKQESGYENLVETGTFTGNTIIWAASVFKNCFTIEINKSLSDLASQRSDCPKNIQFIVGDSKTELKKLVPTLSDKTIFWLDGHYSGEGTGGVDNECPVMDELDAIKILPNSLILIDDARFFLGPPPLGHRAKDWPGLDEIILKLKTNFPNHYSSLVDDTIISVPQQYKFVLDNDWQKNFYIRYPKQKQSKTLLSSIKKLFS
ncbi:MAG: hypothetical protein Q7W45_13455 [Bacteroidota bacterium]|nr:hypothetical protein [Bacteroidota bacterium]MDP3144472.1 hypothetical protein [Bacteroidota bacterium]MDP3555850.1 hypothetical protein [Bacteroidota bacterium]